MNYSRNVWPPCPIIEVNVRAVGNSSLTRSVLAKLDTGADMSLIPQALVEELTLEAADATQATSYNGTETEVLTYFVNLELAGYSFEAVEVVAALRDTALIGRDVLNRFIITLDGKRQTFEMVDP